MMMKRLTEETDDAAFSHTNRRDKCLNGNSSKLIKALAFLILALTMCLLAALCYSLTNKDSFNNENHSNPATQKIPSHDNHSSKHKSITGQIFEEKITALEKSFMSYIESTKKKVTDMEETVVKLQQNYNKTVAALKEKCDTAEEKITELELQNEEINEKIITVEKMVADGQQRTNAVEEMFHMNISSLKQMFEEFDSSIPEMDLQNETIRQNINTLADNHEDLERRIFRMELDALLRLRNMEQNAVPIGFIYKQLPGKLPPTSLWPNMVWKDVSLEYAGLFFRVIGKTAASFGVLQKDNTRSLAQAFYATNSLSYGDPTIPVDGSWSVYAKTGKDGTGNMYGIKFRLSTGEVRPENKAIRIWQRMK